MVSKLSFSIVLVILVLLSPSLLMEIGARQVPTGDDEYRNNKDLFSMLPRGIVPPSGPSPCHNILERKRTHAPPPFFPPYTPPFTPPSLFPSAPFLFNPPPPPQDPILQRKTAKRVLEEEQDKKEKKMVSKLSFSIVLMILVLLSPSLLMEIGARQVPTGDDEYRNNKDLFSMLPRGIAPPSGPSPCHNILERKRTHAPPPFFPPYTPPFTPPSLFPSAPFLFNPPPPPQDPIVCP
ncbi:hypothetical protein CTI12_AA478020 [Artemisia annua]|uniref:Hydroxyproline-rich glycoprotein family protein n=1 Tax=Artemisia annua TaxID=35608 RepID=A0A2U1LLF8_ARTAN|nr:hypothetical protein CTI12_AA478020 [Artemisia annua]